jgi:hypothetical protein
MRAIGRPSERQQTYPLERERRESLDAARTSASATVHDAPPVALYVTNDLALLFVELASMKALDHEWPAHKEVAYQLAAGPGRYVRRMYGAKQSGNSSTAFLISTSKSASWAVRHL